MKFNVDGEDIVRSATFKLAAYKNDFTHMSCSSVNNGGTIAMLNKGKEVIQEIETEHGKISLVLKVLDDDGVAYIELRAIIHNPKE
jgi:hypothetical protein